MGTVRVTSLAVCLRGSLTCLCKHLTRKNISTDIMTEPSGHSQSASRPHGPSTPTPLYPWLCPQPHGRPSPLGASVSPPVKREGEEGALNYLCISSSLTFLSVILLATLSPVWRIPDQSLEKLPCSSREIWSSFCKTPGNYAKFT